MWVRFRGGRREGSRRRVPHTPDRKWLGEEGPPWGDSVPHPMFMILIIWLLQLLGNIVV